VLVSFFTKAHKKEKKKAKTQIIHTEIGSTQNFQLCQAEQKPEKEG